MLIGASVQVAESVILGDPKYADPRSLGKHRSQVYSQCGEDGAIAEIFRRIGAPLQTFVEIGAGDGVQNNTRLLLESGWSGEWWECDPQNVIAIRGGYAEELASGRLKLVDGPATVESVARRHPGGQAGTEWVDEQIDLLSVDIDMNTPHIWRALKHLRPRAAVIEYNALLPPSVEWEVDYDPAATWNGDSRYGASLKRLERLGRDLGYALVGCEITGINAFFVRDDLARPEHFVSPFTAEQHYEPLRQALLFRMRHTPWQRPRTELRSAA